MKIPVKPTAFQKFLLNEVQKFTDNTFVISAENTFVISAENTFVISAENTKEEFWLCLLEYYDEWENEIPPMTKEYFMDNIKEDWVHFHYGVNDENYGENEAMWWLGSKRMKGAKKVWTYYFITL